MNTVTENALEFMKSELKKAQNEVSQMESRREGVASNINSNNGNSYQLFFKSIDAITEKSIKISKQDLGELNENLLIGLVLLIEKRIESFISHSINCIFKPKLYI